MSISHTSRNGHPYTLIEGQVGAKVKAAALKLSDGHTVQATVEHGWFVAWWPGGSNVRSITITTPAGTHTEGVGRLSAPPASGFGFAHTGGRAQHGKRVVSRQTLESIRP